MSEENALKSGAAVNTTTTLREWFGWFGVAVWFFHMNNCYIYMPSGYSDDNIFRSVLAFKLIFAASAALFGLRFGKEPNGVGRLAVFMGPVGVALTATFSFAPVPLGSAMYAVSPFFIAPVAVRLAFGVIRTARPGYTLTTFMCGVGAAFATVRVTFIFTDLYDEGVLPDLPVKLMYLIYALSIVPAWFAARRSVTLIHRTLDGKRPTISKTMVALLAAAILLTFWLLAMKSRINYAAEEFDDILYVPVYDVIPCLAYAFLGFIGDRRLERPVITTVLVIYLVTIQVWFLAGYPGSPAGIPLVIVNQFFGHIIEYLLWTIPIYFIAYVKRPVFMASLCLTLYLSCWAFRWVVSSALPEALKTEGAPLFFTTSITAIAFFLMLQFFFQHYRKNTLAAALYSLLYVDESTESPPADTQAMAGAGDTQAMVDARLPREEIKIAVMMIDGMSYRDIAHKLNMSAAEFGSHVKAIRRKLNLLGDPDPVIAAVIAEYKLTKRETEILRFLRDSKTNDEIAAELYLSGNTIKVHIRNLMMKIPVEKKSDIPEWLESCLEKTIVKD